MVAIVSFCMETLPSFERPVCLNVTTDGGRSYFMRPNYEDPFFIVESVNKFHVFSGDIYNTNIRYDNDIFIVC